jgi:hypothetical protein
MLRDGAMRRNNSTENSRFVVMINRQVETTENLKWLQGGCKAESVAFRQSLTFILLEG